MANVTKRQVLNALTKQSSSGWGSLGFVVIVFPVDETMVVAVINPQDVGIGKAVGVGVW